MKNKEGGFAVPLLLISIIAILLIGGGIYLYFNRSPVVPTQSRTNGDTTPATGTSSDVQATNTSTSNMTSGADLTSDPYSGKDVYIFVDDVTYNALSQKIARLATDIKDDLGVQVIVDHGTYADPLDIRKVLAASFGKNELLGSILIGNIPTFKRDDGLYTDWFYQDFSDRCAVSSEGRFSSSLQCNTLDSVSRRSVFTGRITPSLSGQDGIDQIGNYLDKDHSFRSGNISFPKKLLVYPSVELIQKNNNKPTIINGLQANMNSAIASQSRYAPQDVDAIYDSDYTAAKTDYLNKLSANRYESALIDMHGTPDGQFPAGVYGNNEIHSADIVKAKPNVLYVNLLSCSNGAFNSPDYLAGAFLFNGDTLLVTANTVEAAIGDLLPDPPLQANFFEPLSFLNSDAPLGELFRHDTSLYVTQTFGDPTLRLKGSPVASRIQVGLTPLNFASSTSSGSISIKNIGGVSASILALPFSGIAINDQILNSYSPVGPLQGEGFLGFQMDNVIPFSKITLSPGQGTVITVHFSPAARLSSNKGIQGVYKDFLTLLSSDQHMPYIDIPLTATY